MGCGDLLAGRCAFLGALLCPAATPNNIADGRHRLVGDAAAHAAWLLGRGISRQGLSRYALFRSFLLVPGGDSCGFVLRPCTKTDMCSDVCDFCDRVSDSIFVVLTADRHSEHSKQGALGAMGHCCGDVDSVFPAEAKGECG